MSKLSRFSPVALLLAFGSHAATAGSPFCTDIPPTRTVSEAMEIPPSGGECSINVVQDATPMVGSASTDLRNMTDVNYQGVLSFDIVNATLRSASDRSGNSAKLLEAGFISGKGTKYPSGIRVDATLTQRSNGTLALVFDFLSSVPVAESIAVEPSSRGADMLLQTSQALIDSKSCELPSPAVTVTIDRTRPKGTVIGVSDSAGTNLCQFLLGPSLPIDLTPPLLRWGLVTRTFALNKMSYQAIFRKPELNCVTFGGNCGHP